jgi:hypothetical protein
MTLTGILLQSITFVSSVYLGAELWRSLYLYEQMSILSQVSEQALPPVKFQLYPTNGEWLRAAGVWFQVVETLPCDRPVFFDRVGREQSATATLICVDRDEYTRREANRLVFLEDWRKRFVSNVVPEGKTTDGTPLIKEAQR